MSKAEVTMPLDIPDVKVLKIDRSQEREVLRRLAGRVAELASRPIESEKRQLWLEHNQLKPTRPLIFCDPENGWNEIITPADLECHSQLARQWEMRLRKEVFWGEQLCDDRVTEPIFEVAHVYTESDWGMHEIRIGGDQGGAYTWESPLKDYADFSSLHFPQISINDPATEQALSLANHVFGDLLQVRLKTDWWWTLGLTWTLINLRGLTQVMYDLHDHPDDLHRLMAFLRDGHMAKLDFLEQNGLLSLNNDGTYVGSGGFGWTDELPQPDFNGHVRTCDLWGFAESQETTGISPNMFAEFIFPYQYPLLERFGLNCYGCCEPLDKRWHIVERLPHLRRISVSPWANIPFMAERLGNRYVFSMKPSPTDLALPGFDEDDIRRKIRRSMQITRDCRVEVIMKDNHTLCNDPQRAIRWVRIAREESDAL